VSLSQEPALSMLRDRFVCGYRDITGEPWAGRSGTHAPGGQAIRTTNGAGPRNLQLFMLAPDGTVLHALPGYWSAPDLAHELEFAGELLALWRDPSVSRTRKDAEFARLHLEHARRHPPSMVAHSRMQSFDQKFEARRRLYASDTILDPARVAAAMASGDRRLPQEAFKTTDVIAHERMAQRPFVPFAGFDVAQFVDYGKPKYDKHEDERLPDGRRADRPGAAPEHRAGMSSEERRAMRRALRRERAGDPTSPRP
jgi:hypothetical protein